MLQVEGPEQAAIDYEIVEDAPDGLGHRMFLLKAATANKFPARLYELTESDEAAIARLAVGLEQPPTAGSHPIPRRRIIRPAPRLVTQPRFISCPPRLPNMPLA